MKNVGKTDKMVRLVLGIVVIIAGVVFKSWWGLVGLVLLITALLNFCPLYVPFKINTARKKP
ncbi:DUF2892 domain-containing protein [candidate division KSB1 bacterium]|nr:DUF2892 domain-containing protein [candidate division KSB1 bacterium]